MNLSLEFAERKSLLVGMDGIMGGASVMVAVTIWEGWGGVQIEYSYFLSHIEWLALILLWFLLVAACGVYELQVASRLTWTFRALAVASSTVLSIYFVVYFFSPPGSLPRVMALAQVFSLLGLIGIWRSGYVLFMSSPGFRPKILIVGAGAAGQAIARVAERERNLPCTIVGFIDDDPAKEKKSFLHCSVLGGAKSLVKLSQDLGISEVVFAITGDIRPELFRALLACEEQGIRITPMSDLYEELTGRIPLEHIGGGNWHVVLPLHHPQTRTLYQVFKRLIDILVAIIGLLLFAPIFPFLAVALWIESRGPIFYRQPRLGKGGRVFQLVKLRTMIPDAESSGMRTAPQDPRVTRVGRLLRMTMVDEAPQFWNVLKGETSIVGPRPEQPELVADLEQRIPFYRLRNAVKPGMAGWALIHQGHIQSFEEAVTRLEYDLYYIKYQSLWLDVLIILRTIGKALTLRRAERVAKGQIIG